MSSSAPSLTAKQRHALRSIVDHIEAHGVAPSIFELSATLGLSHSMASHAYMGVLESKGYLRRRFGVARSIVVLRNEDGTEIAGADEAA